MVEMRNLTLMNMVRSMIGNSDPSLYLRSEALKSMVYGLNKVPNTVVHKTSFELWKCWKYNLKHRYVLCCLTKVGVNYPHEIKLDSRIVNG